VVIGSTVDVINSMLMTATFVVGAEGEEEPQAAIALPLATAKAMAKTLLLSTGPKLHLAGLDATPVQLESGDFVQRSFDCLTRLDAPSAQA